MGSNRALPFPTDAEGNKVPYAHVIPGGHSVNLKAAKNNFNSFLKEFTPN